MFRYAPAFFAIVVTLGLRGVARCDVEGSPASLRGVSTVQTKIKLDLDETSESAFVLSQLAVQRDLEKLLTNGGLTIAAQNPDAVVRMLLKIRVLPRDAGINIFMYRLEMAVEQQAALQRDPTKTVTATTWRSAEAGLGLQRELKNNLPRLIERQANELVEAWKKAQP